jgi:dTDP-4-dehydrorhamnose 3,5-epimerase
MDGVLVTPLRRITAPAGAVLHGLKASSPGYIGFAEAYFSEIHEGAIKDWRKHTRMTMNLVVPRGNVRFVFHAETSGLFTEYLIGEANYARLTVAPGLWMAFRGEGPGTSLILDITDLEHDPAEAQSRNVSAFAYTW